MKFFPFFLLALFLHPAQAPAQIWSIHKSKSKAYDVEFPNPPEITESYVRLEENLVAYSSKMVYRENVDDLVAFYRIGKDSVEDAQAPAPIPQGAPGYEGGTHYRTFQITVDQPLDDGLLPGWAISRQEVLNKTDPYLDYYESIGGQVVQDDLYPTKDYALRVLTVALPDEDRERGNHKVVRMKLYLNPVNYIQMVSTMPFELEQDYITEKFMSSLNVFSGRSYEEGNFEDEWVYYPTTDDDIFFAFLPPVAPRFTMASPVYEKQEGYARLETEIHDLFHGNRLHYALTAYEFTGDPVTRVLFDRYLDQYHTPPNTGREDTSYSQFGLDGVVTVFSIPGTGEEPELSHHIRVALYGNNVFGKHRVVIQDVWGSEKMMGSYPAWRLFGALHARLDGEEGGAPVGVSNLPIDRD